MTSIISNEHSICNDPSDPRYYAPRRGRLVSTPPADAAEPMRSDYLPPPSSRSRFDEMRDEALAKSKQHLPDLQVVSTRRSAPVLLVSAVAIAAAVGLGAIVAIVIINMDPRSKSTASEFAASISAPASATPVHAPTNDSHALLQGFMQFEQSQRGRSPEHAASGSNHTGQTEEAHEKSEALLEKFIQWGQRK